MARNEAKYQITAVNKTDKAIKQAESNFNKLDGVVKKASLALGVFTGATVAVAVPLVALGKHVVQVGDQIDKMSKQIGVSAQEFQQLSFIAQRSGTNIEQLTSGISLFQKNIVDASNGTGEAVNALKALGLSAEELKNQTPTQALQTISTALDGISNEAEKTNYRLKILGDGGKALAPLLEEGADGIGNLADSFNRLTGGGLTEKQVADAVALADAWTDVSTVTDSFLTQSFATLVPLIQDAVVAFTELIALPLREWVTTNSVFLEGIATGFRSLYDDDAFSDWVLSVVNGNRSVNDSFVSVREELENFDNTINNLNALGTGAGIQITPQQNPLQTYLDAIEEARTSLQRLQNQQRDFLDEAEQELVADENKRRSRSGLEDLSAREERQFLNRPINKNKAEELAERLEQYWLDRISLYEKILERRQDQYDKKLRQVEEEGLAKELAVYEEFISSIRRELQLADPSQQGFVSPIQAIPEPLFNPLQDVELTPTEELARAEEWADVQRQAWVNAMTTGISEFNNTFIGAFADGIRNMNMGALDDFFKNFGEMLERATLNALASAFEVGLSSLFNIGLSFLPGPFGQFFQAAAGMSTGGGGSDFGDTWYNQGGGINNMNAGGGPTYNVQMNTVLPPAREDIRRAQQTFDEIALEGSRFAL